LSWVDAFGPVALLPSLGIWQRAIFMLASSSRTLVAKVSYSRRWILPPERHITTVLRPHRCDRSSNTRTSDSRWWCQFVRRWCASDCLSSTDSKRRLLYQFVIDVNNSSPGTICRPEMWQFLVAEGFVKFDVQQLSEGCVAYLNQRTCRRRMLLIYTGVLQTLIFDSGCVHVL